MNENSIASELRALLGRIAGHVLLFGGVLLTPTSLWFLLTGDVGWLLVAAHLCGWLSLVAGLSLIYSN